MKKITLLIIATLMVLLTACQPTPEKEIVQNKNNGVMEKAISSGKKVDEASKVEENQNEPVIADKEVEERAEMQSTGKWVDNDIEGKPYISISANADILMPDVTEYKAYEIIPMASIPEETLRKLIHSLVGDNPLYDGNEKSKEEIEKTILNLKKFVYDYENDEFKDTFSDDQGITYEEFKSENIKSLQEHISKLEEDIAKGNYGVNTVVDIDEINFERTEDNMLDYFKADLGRNELAKIRMCEKCNFALNNPGKYFIDYQGNNISEYVPEEEKELEISSDSALEMINTLMDDVGITPYDLRYMGINKQYNGMEELADGYLQQGYVMVFSRIVNGMPVECTSDFNVHELANELDKAGNFADEMKLYAENLSFVVDDKGIAQIDWEYHYDIDEQSARIIEIMPMDDDLKRIIVQQMINCYSFYERDNIKTHFDIERVELVMGRVPMKNNFDRQWLVPVWNVYANYEVKQAGEDPYKTSSSRLVLSINALDGSVN